MSGVASVSKSSTGLDITSTATVTSVLEVTGRTKLSVLIDTSSAEVWRVQWSTSEDGPFVAFATDKTIAAASAAKGIDGIDVSSVGFVRAQVATTGTGTSSVHFYAE